MKATFTKTLAALFICALIAACGGSGGSDGDDDVNDLDDTAGSHNAGTDCGASNCHSASTIDSDKRWTYSGTIYSALNSTTPASGAQIVITDSTGTITLTSDRNGNFYTTAGAPGGGYTAMVTGNTVNMVANQTNGSCSTSGCHGSSATPAIYRN